MAIVVYSFQDYIRKLTVRVYTMKLEEKSNLIKLSL